MIPKILGFLATAALLVALPLAAAQDGEEPANDESTSDQAWVDDCPPDMMCAMSGPAEGEPAKDANGTTDEATYPGDCGAEVCAYDSHQGGGEDHVQAPEGSEGGITSVDEDAETAFSVPVAGIVVALGALGLAAVVVAARR